MVYIKCKLNIGTMMHNMFRKVAICFMKNLFLDAFTFYLFNHFQSKHEKCSLLGVTREDMLLKDTVKCEYFGVRIEKDARRVKALNAEQIKEELQKTLNGVLQT